MLSEVRIDSRSWSDGSSISGERPLKLITDACAWFVCEQRMTHMSHRLTFTERKSDRDSGLLLNRDVVIVFKFEVGTYLPDRTCTLGKQVNVSHSF